MSIRRVYGRDGFELRSTSVNKLPYVYELRAQPSRIADPLLQPWDRAGAYISKRK